ncbi:hypothetical protein HGRIS_011507 [Hohenbuehelia grisea]|uniref:Uncharacterized protein n=1 Tax=Hohenbuehelia grisea TaxID=104357 RepID=A0ABR3JXB8_9AGAR
MCSATARVEVLQSQNLDVDIALASPTSNPLTLVGLEGGFSMQAATLPQPGRKRRMNVRSSLDAFPIRQGRTVLKSRGGMIRLASTVFLRGKPRWKKNLRIKTPPRLLHAVHLSSSLRQRVRRV